MDGTDGVRMYGQQIQTCSRNDGAALETRGRDVELRRLSHSHQCPPLVPTLPALHIMAISVATLASDHLDDRITPIQSGPMREGAREGACVW